MGFDIGFYDPKTQELIDSERICNVEGFFALAELLTQLTRLLDENKVPWHLDNPQAMKPYEVFRAYVANDREEYEERFADYCAFVRGAMAEARKLAGEGGSVLGGNPSIRPKPEEFAPDVRVFLSRSLLGGEPLAPDEAGELLQTLIWVLVLFSSFEAYFKNAQPDLSRHIHSLGESIITLGRFLERGVSDDRLVLISG